MRTEGVDFHLYSDCGMPQFAFTVYSWIAWTSAMNRWLLSARNALITLNTESLKPPMFMMSARSQA